MADGLINRARLSAAKPAVATPLLQFLAGPHAGAIASVWPAPHRDFLALPAARRHAAAILLARGERDLAGLANMVERHKDGALAKRLAYGSETAGLMKAMARMGETLWTMEQYARFLGLFDSARANRILRHMDEIRPGQLAVIHALPAALHEAAIVAKIPGVGAARDLGLALALVERMHGARTLADLRKGLAAARDMAGLFAKAADALTAEVFRGPALAPDLPVPFVRVRSASELDKIALEFQNCLRDFKGDMVLGRMAAYVWKGQPEVVLALRWDPAGWRLAEAELHANEEAPEDVLHLIVDALAVEGVRTGPSTFTLANRLRRHPYGDPEHIGETWRESLELGELWD
ncbi:MAG: hypothetical protein MRY64_08180 [Hyphomonadaceae bacterium]|nr:hypothetical protein [Hyphomonadaceae bacterium]